MLGEVDETITVLKKRQLPQGKYSYEVYKTAARFKKICMENVYTWKTMDEDILEEAAKMVENDASK